MQHCFLGNRAISGVRDGHRNRKSQKSLRFRCAKLQDGARHRTGTANRNQKGNRFSRNKHRNRNRQTGTARAVPCANCDRTKPYWCVLDCAPELALCFMGPWTFAWIRCPQLPYDPCENGTHSTGFCNIRGHVSTISRRLAKGIILEWILGEGDATKQRSVKKSAFSLNNEGFVKEIYRKDNSLNKFQPSNESPDSRN